uniref:UDP-glucose/GDP-mannose dehydrogenase dimerisation domain-containing protein n=1 Tax=viral metagenome TaxID=1070528 RepID=A0A6C0HLM6_9ZZZZ
MWNIGIIGLGVLGNAIYETFKNTINHIKTIVSYDKYKGIGSIESIKDCDIVFLCLPTEYSDTLSQLNIGEIDTVCKQLVKLEYSGIILLKSTVEPGTCEQLNAKYTNLKIIHNPEFLTARTAQYDFAHQLHIILGLTSYSHVDSTMYIVKFYSVIFNAVMFNGIIKNTIVVNDNDNDNDTNNGDLSCMPSNADAPIISICSSLESETIKLACNSFYATKIQFFTEINLLCSKIGIEYNNVKNKMLMNGWINPMHTDVPGHDGQISFGGACFPKDINALNSFMQKNNIVHRVINSVVIENKEMRGPVSCGAVSCEVVIL